MRTLFCLFPLLVSAALAIPSGQEQPPAQRKIAGFRLQDHRGAWHSLDDAKDKKLVVVAFLGTQCPLAQQYAPRLVELAREFEGKGAAFFGIMSNQHDLLKDMEGYVQSHKVPFPVLKDLGNEVADQFGAQRTPETFVLDGERRIRYAGRIDDQYGIGYKRPRPTQRYLATALDELLAGKPVSRAAAESVGCFIGRAAMRAAKGDLTYAKDIAPILKNRCASCHQPGDIAPFPLTTYKHAAAWAESMREVVSAGRMPPWHADPQHGKFSNDPRLSDAEKQAIEQWVQNGMPRGEGTDEPLVSPRTDGWRIGKPDFVIRLPKPFKVPATGVVDYQYYIIDPGFKEDRWVKASEVRPSARAVVHHGVVFVQPPGESVVDKQGFGFEMLAGYGPGVPPRVLKDGLAKFIPAGSRLVFQMHYTPCGIEQTDQTEVGLVFADPKEVKKEHRTGLAITIDIRIPPGAKDHRVESVYLFRQDTLLLTMAPHMHLRGKSFRFEAHYPDGKREILLDVPRYDFEWQHLYDLAEPKLMPEGTRLICVATYDNSAENLSNPDPSATVTFGLQTWQEMMVGFFLMAPADQDLTLGEPKVKPLGNGDHEATFTYRPSQPAKTVHLAGSFNKWKADGHKMDGPDAGGAFTTRVVLKKGTHEYKFVLDGKTWKHDRGNRRQSGHFNNSVLIVGAGS